MKATAENAGCGIRFFTLEKTCAIIHKASPSQHIFLIGTKWLKVKKAFTLSHLFLR